MEIEDDFLDQTDLIKLQSLMMSKNQQFPWYYNDGIDYGVMDSEGVMQYPAKEEKNKFQFTHMIYQEGAPCSSTIKILTPILNKIKPFSIARIKANLLTRTQNNVENTFHVDMGGLPEEKLKQWITSIFYVNTNNGYTKFQDGTKVESVENRMVTFQANMKHTGVSCTDEKTRVVINFNYYTSHE